MRYPVEDFEIHYATEEDMRSFDPAVAAKELIQFAVEVRSNDVFITDESDRVSIRMKRLGKIELLQCLSKEAGRRLQNHFRAVGGADVTDHVKPVDGREVIELDNGVHVDVRISGLPNIFGQDLALRLFHTEQAVLQLEQLGFLEPELELVRGLLDTTGGLVLVSGPTGSGKTSSLYAFLRHLNRGDVKIHTLEEPVEFVLPGVVQSQVNTRMGVGYAELLHALMRHSPDVLMIGEIRDPKTAEVAVRAGGSGQLVIATVHARTAIGSIQSMLSFGVNSNFLANSLSGVVSQRLVRRLCAQCSVKVRITQVAVDSSERHGEESLDGTQFLSMPTGCDNCSDGYDQMTCIPEILRVGKQMREAISQKLDAGQLFQIAEENGLWSFRRAASERLGIGLSTVEELMRVAPDSSLAESMLGPLESKSNDADVFDQTSA